MTGPSAAAHSAAFCSKDRPDRNPFLLAQLNPASVLRSTTEQAPYHHWAATQIDVGGNTTTKNDVVVDGSPNMASEKSAYTPDDGRCAGSERATECGGRRVRPLRRRRPHRADEVGHELRFTEPATTWAATPPSMLWRITSRGARISPAITSTAARWARRSRRTSSSTSSPMKPGAVRIPRSVAFTLAHRSRAHGQLLAVDQRARRPAHDLRSVHHATQWQHGDPHALPWQHYSGSAAGPGRDAA